MGSPDRKQRPSVRRRRRLVAGSAAFALVGLTSVACEATPPGYVQLDYRVGAGDVLFLSDSRSLLGSGRPSVTAAVDARAVCNPAVVDDHLSLRYDDVASIDHPGDPLARRTSWTLEGGYVVLQVRDDPECLDHDRQVVVIETTVRAEDGIVTPLRTYVVPADSELAGTFNRAALVK